MIRILVSLALVACSTAPATPRGLVALDAPSTDARAARRAAEAAALLDPRCWRLEWTRTGALDVTVPDGHGWYVGNALAVQYGEPVIYAQDEYPGSRSSGFVRTLSTRHTLYLPGGTRIRNSAYRGPDGDHPIQLAYVWRCDPDDVIAVDARYATDPIGLLAAREDALRTLPRQHVILEATGGGSTGEGPRGLVPCGDPGVMLLYAEVYDASWLTIGAPDAPDAPPPLNTVDEISNAHRQRHAAPDTLMPFACGAGLEIVLQKGNAGDRPNSDTDGWDPVGQRWADDPVRPIHGSGDVLVVQLPEGW